MTAVSLINPYAPQPAQGTGPEGMSALASAQPVSQSGAGRETGTSSDQAGYGAGSNTGTGGAYLDSLLARRRDENQPSDATPESVVEAQTKTDAAAAFLDRQARQQTEARAAEEARAADRAAARADAAQEEAAAAAEPEYVMPNPLPTAPILERDQP
ncbi:hypothetical protein [uncultured Roseobacter sp.]|uniref:hypothetical protein n=1 Tax=uncultured Roseobacter sp. TaxID=114847 RepID=UPI002637CCBB|nr:hypothetical protein [uncultured Roseobacter sp.]